MVCVLRKGKDEKTVLSPLLAGFPAKHLRLGGIGAFERNKSMFARTLIFFAP